MSFDQPQFAARLRALRAEKDVPQKTVADAIRVDPSTVSMWESADRMPGADSVAALAGYYGVSADYLLCRSDFRFGLPPDEYLVDQDLLESVLKARGREELRALAEPIDAITASGEPFIAKVKGFTWAVKVPRRPRLVGRTEYEQLRSSVTKAVKEVARESRNGGVR